MMHNTRSKITAIAAQAEVVKFVVAVIVGKNSTFPLDTALCIEFYNRRNRRKSSRSSGYDTAAVRR